MTATIGALTDERVAELLNNRASSTVATWDYEMRCAMLDTIAARDAEIARLREALHAVKESSNARSARVALLEAAVGEFCAVAVTDSNIRIRPGSRVGDALEKLIAIASKEPI